MVRKHPNQDKASKMWRREKTVDEWGTHDDWQFIPHRQDLPLRCFQCSNLMAADFTAEGECPNCHWVFSKSEARDMYVETLIANLSGGWDKKKLDLFSPYDYPVRMEPDGTIKRIEDVERTMAAWATKAHRMREAQDDIDEQSKDPNYKRYMDEMKRRFDAERALIEDIRSQNPVNQL